MTDDNVFDEVGRELRHQLSGEFRLAAEETEYWAMKQARRAGTLAEIGYDAMSRGDRIEVWAGECSYRGFVVHARNDLLSLEAQTHVDVNLAAPVVLRVVDERVVAGRDPSPSGAESFSARLAELEQTGSECRFVVPYVSGPVTGRVAIRARDHVIVADEERTEWVIPLRWLMAVARHRS